MASFIWKGPAPPEAVRSALRAHELARGPHADLAHDDLPAIVFTTTARTPRQTGSQGRWLWLCRDAVSESQRTAAVLAGAYDVVSLTTPDAIDELLERLDELFAPQPIAPSVGTLVTRSEASKRVVAQVARAAPTSMSVLLTGETGTGKEVMAKLLHAWSPRHRKPFIPINCAAIPNDLMEAELFGYARGAFSGAVQRYDGQLMAAEGGTVLLDEIDETPPETQVKLLRVLEDHVVSRLGENIWHEVDFRLLAATNRDLGALIDAGLFGADLYERLAIVTIQLAPLRERLDDLPDLAAHFMERFAREQNQPPLDGIRADAMRALAAYPWPGNIRELRNVLYQTLVYKRAGTHVLLSDLPRRVLVRGDASAAAGSVDRTAVAHKIRSGGFNLREEVAALERAAVDEALRRSGGNAAQAARLLGQVGRGASRDPGGTVRAMIRRLKSRE